MDGSSTRVQLTTQHKPPLQDLIHKIYQRGIPSSRSKSLDQQLEHIREFAAGYFPITSKVLVFHATKHSARLKELVQDKALVSNPIIALRSEPDSVILYWNKQTYIVVGPDIPVALL